MISEIELHNFYDTFLIQPLTHVHDVQMCNEKDGGTGTGTGTF
jgi:hypothetical protein